MDGLLYFKFRETPMYLQEFSKEKLVFSPRESMIKDASKIHDEALPWCFYTPSKGIAKPYYLVNKNGLYFTKEETFSDSNYIEFESFEFAKETAKRFDAFIIPINHTLLVVKNGIPVDFFEDYQEAINCATKLLSDEDEILIYWIDTLKNNKIVVKEDPLIYLARKKSNPKFCFEFLKQKNGLVEWLHSQENFTRTQKEYVDLEKKSSKELYNNRYYPY